MPEPHLCPPVPERTMLRGPAARRRQSGALQSRPLVSLWYGPGGPRSVAAVSKRTSHGLPEPHLCPPVPERTMLRGPSARRRQSGALQSRPLVSLWYGPGGPRSVAAVSKRTSHGLPEPHLCPPVPERTMLRGPSARRRQSGALQTRPLVSLWYGPGGPRSVAAVSKRTSHGLPEPHLCPPVPERTMLRGPSVRRRQSGALQTRPLVSLWNGLAKGPDELHGVCVPAFALVSPSEGGGPAAMPASRRMDSISRSAIQAGRFCQTS